MVNRNHSGPSFRGCCVFPTPPEECRSQTFSSVRVMVQRVIWLCHGLLAGGTKRVQQEEQGGREPSPPPPARHASTAPRRSG